MKIVMIVIFSSTLYADSLKVIQFDLVGQFGSINKNGGLVWNNDWLLDGLLFDGTWQNFPGTYGELTKNSYNDKLSNNEKNDSNKVESFFKYKQGDYLLDQFLSGLKYKSESRNFYFNAYKRNYLGPYNQYSNNTNQPIQQSYTFSYDSKKNGYEGGFKMGHFNTYSGLADSANQGFINNKVTSSKILYNQIYDEISFFSSLDQFMQRYQADHSKSFFKGVRYLSRSRFILGFGSFNRHNDYFQLKSTFNSRNIRNYNQFNSWFKTEIGGRKKWLEINTGIIYSENKFGLSYKIKFNKKVKAFEFYLENSRSNKILHPFYEFYYTGLHVDPFYQISMSKASFSMLGKSNKTLFSMSIFNESNDHFLENIKKKQAVSNKDLKNIFWSLNANHRLNLFSSSELELDYQIQDPDNYYSGGYGNWFELNFHSNIDNFKSYMDINFLLGFKHIGKRQSSSYLNLIEMVPIDRFSFKILDDLNYFSSEISLEVSDLIIKYEWKNISEIILNTFGSENNNHFKMHPEMPPIVRQSNFSIEWHFRD